MIYFIRQGFPNSLLISVQLCLLVEKTIEGTAAGITSVLAACSVLLPLLASTGYIVTEVCISILTLLNWHNTIVARGTFTWIAEVVLWKRNHEFYWFMNKMSPSISHI